MFFCNFYVESRVTGFVKMCFSEYHPVPSKSAPNHGFFSCRLQLMPASSSLDIPASITRSRCDQLVTPVRSIMTSADGSLGPLVSGGCRSLTRASRRSLCDYSSEQHFSYGSIRTPHHNTPHHTTPHHTTPHHTTPHHTSPHHTIPGTSSYHAIPHHRPFHTIDHTSCMLLTLCFCSGVSELLRGVASAC